MSILHIHWRPPNTVSPYSVDAESVLFVWLEVGGQPAPKPGRLTERKRAQTHPFTRITDALRELLAELGLSHTLTRQSRLVLRLPTNEYGPLPSRQLAHHWTFTEAGSPAILNPWRVTGVILTALEGLAVLVALLNPDYQPKNWHLSEESRYWLVAATLVLEGLTRGQLTPLDLADGANQLHQIPTIADDDLGQRLTRLGQLLPSICLAESRTSGLNLTAEMMLASFINVMTYALALEQRFLRFAGLGGQIKKYVYRWLINNLPDESTLSALNRYQLRLHQNYHYWQQCLNLSTDANFRGALRLEAPDPTASETLNTADTSLWTIHPLLQSRSDPSLLIPADTVATEKPRLIFNRRQKQSIQILQASFAYAARIFSPLASGSDTELPQPQPLSVSEAYHFLRDAAPLLESSGIGVLIPPWWNNTAQHIKARLILSPQADLDAVNPTLGADALIRYEWQLSLGDTPLTQAEFDALVALKAPLVEIRGQWVQLETDQIETAIHFWEQQAQSGELSALEAMRLGLGTRDEAHGLPVGDVEYQGWMQTWIEQLTQPTKLKTLPPPEGLQAELRPYQNYGYSWLAFMRRQQFGVCLADDMGLGKTIQTLATLLKDKQILGELPGPTLIICPTSVVTNWQLEVERFTPDLKSYVHQGKTRLKEQAFIQQLKQVDLVLTSYTLVRLEAATMQTVNWYGVILDEAQNIKNPDTKQAQTIRGLKAQFRVALTGTPIENRLGELWSIMQFLNPGYLGNRKAFQTTFAQPIERHNHEETAQRLRQIVSPLILRRVKTDPAVIQDLPQKQESKVYCTLSKEQATLYEATVQKALSEMDTATGIKRKGAILGLLTRLKQICNHPAHFLHQINNESLANPYAEMRRSGKLTRLTEILEETLAVGDHSLLFTQFTEMGRFLQRYIEQQLAVETLFLHGGIPGDQRAKMVERFQTAHSGPPIFILSLKAGGTGLNLTRANQIFHFDRWWNPAVEDQATDRAFRIGQTRHVQVYKFICQGTLEGSIDQIIERKKALADSIVGQGENWLTELTTEELRKLVELRQ